MRNVPMAVVAAALGNTEAVCAKHYAHLAPGYIANAIREHAGGLGIVPATNLTSIGAVSQPHTDRGCELTPALEEMDESGDGWQSSRRNALFVSKSMT
jgi:hypothetical protein